MRKKGKLPWRTIAQDDELEYGTDTMEVHADAIGADEQVLPVDDLIARADAAEAAVKLIGKLGGGVMGASFVVDLPELGERANLEAMGIPTNALCAFEGH